MELLPLDEWVGTWSIHIQILPTGYVGLIWRSTAEATASWSIDEGTLRVHRSYCDR